MDIISYDPSSFLTDGTYLVEKATFDTEWTVAEQIHTLYGMINLDADLGGVALRGNVGLQYVDTTQKSTGTLTNFGVNNVKDSYDRWLPSANLAFEVDRKSTRLNSSH